MAEQTTKNVSDVIVERLVKWGVDRIFGYSGDGINGFMGALQRRQRDIEFVQARHEEMSAFMAVGHAKYTGGVGVCTSTQGPGAVHLLNGLYDAKLDHKPVLAIVGQQTGSVIGSAYQQEIDLHTLFKDACAQYCTTATDAKQMPMVIDRAMRIAITTRSPVCVIVPHDIQVAEAAIPQQEHGSMTSSVGIEWPIVVPRNESIREAAGILDSGSRVAILIGQGAAAASKEVMDLAEHLGAGVGYALMGKGVLDDRLSYVTGAVGHLGTTASWDLMQQCDTLLMIGTNEPWTEFLPAPGQARAVQIDIDGRNLGYRYPTEVNLVGDARETLRALMPMLQRKTDRSWRSTVEASVQEWRLRRARWAAMEADPINPQALFAALSPRIADNAILAIDVGSVTYWWARYIDMHDGMKAALSSTLASMGSAMPYGIAAKCAFSDRPVFALAGDGAMQMNGLSEMITLSRMWRGFKDPRFVMVVLNNGDLNEVSWEMRETEGNPRFAASQDLPEFSYAQYAELLGFAALRLDTPDMTEKVLDEALAIDRPVLIEAIVDPAVPLLAPHLTEQQSQQMLQGLDLEGSDGFAAKAMLLQQDEGQMS